MIFKMFFFLNVDISKIEDNHVYRDGRPELMMPEINLNIQYFKTNDASFYYQMTIKLKLYEILSLHYFKI
jgi:hypothetical protein